MICNVGFASTLISLKDLKLNENINNYFFNQEITEYNYEGEGYGTDSLYSVLFIPQSKLKDKEYDSITISFNNKSKKISYYAGFVEKFKNLNKCLEYRDKQVSVVRTQTSKNGLVGLPEKIANNSNTVNKKVSERAVQWVEWLEKVAVANRHYLAS